MSSMRTIICDDVKSICEGYKMFMDNEDDFECVAMTYTAHDCIEKTRELTPDLVLLDIQLNREELGISIIGKLKEIVPSLTVIMLTSHRDNDLVFQSIMAGADGYVIKNADGRKLLEQVRNAYNVKKQKDADTIDIMNIFKEEVHNICDSKASLMYMISSITKLSPVELEVLRYIYSGMTYKEIAQKRFVEEGTVKSATSRILKKFGEKKMKTLIDKLHEINLFDYI